MPGNRVDKGFKLNALKKLGFDEVIDYEETDFTKSGEQYDIILDTKTTRLPSRYLKALKKSGRYITVGGDLPKLVQLVLMKWFLKKVTGKKMDILALKPNKNLDHIKDLCEQKSITPVLDRIFPMEQASDALLRFGRAEHIGKIIISTIE